jgi:uncharacterized protein YgiM (DUF1202 family)
MVSTAAATLVGCGILATAGMADAATASPVATHRPAPTQTHYYKVVGIRKGSTLAVRSSANTHARIIGTLKESAVTTGTGESSHGFLKVNAANGKTGWASATNLQETKKGRN